MRNHTLILKTLNDKENHKAFTYKFTYDKSQDKLDLLLANEDDSTGTLESCVNYVINGEGYFAGVNNWKDFQDKLDEYTKPLPMEV